MLNTAYIGLGIFLLCIILFVLNKIPMAHVAVIGCVLMVLFKVASFDDVFGQFASSTIGLVIGVMIVGKAMTETGATALISGFLDKKSKGNNKAFLMIAVLSCACMSMFTSNLATALIFIPIMQSYSESTNTNVRTYMIPIAMASQIGGICTLVGSAPQLVAQGVIQEFNGYSFSFFEFTKIGIILLALLVAYIYFIGIPLGNKIWGKRDPLAEEQIVKSEKKEINMKKVKIVTAVFVGMIILFYLEWIPIALTAMIGALICIFTGCLGKRKISDCVSWSAVVKLAGTLGLVKAVKVSGGMAMVTGFIRSLLGNEVSPVLLFIVFVVLTTVLSEFLSNSTALMLTLPLALSFCEAFGINAVAMTMGLIMASSVALSTPLSSTSLMLVMDDTYDFKDFVRYGIWYDMTAVIVICICVPLMYPLI